MRVAKDMGKSFSEMENEPLVIISEMGNHRARIEVLRRHIMSVDNVDYEEAGKIVVDIQAKNKEGLFFYSFPYKFGMVAFIFSGIYAFPLIFDLDTAMAFNRDYVTMEIPPPDELDTLLGESFVPVITVSTTVACRRFIVKTMLFFLFSLQRL